MRVAVYNEHWSTAGGGEKYAAAFAQALRDEHDVSLLGPGEVDCSLLEERLGVDLDGVSVDVAGPSPGAMTSASSRYDLLVNCSYMSSERSAAALSVYVVHFPTPVDHDLGPARRAARRALRTGGGPVPLEWGPGFYLPEQARIRRFRWTSGRATFRASVPAGATVPLRLVLAGRPAPLPPVTVDLLVDGEPTASKRIEPGRRTAPLSADLVGREDGAPITLDLVCDGTVVPAELEAGPDRRALGVRLVSAELGRAGARLAARCSWLGPPPVSLAFLDAYDRIVANSAFTAGWVERSWRRKADVVHPAVEPVEPAAAKERILLSVGRFFDPSRGHSKRQLDLVRAFAAAVRDRSFVGWSYHLVGGCSPSDRPYLEAVRREAAGLPVRIHTDADGAELRDLYARASVLWHGTGLGEDAERRPHRLEHFGIALVEAMSAGVVPVVVGNGGPSEIVEDGVTGLTFSSPQELVVRTKRLAGDPDYCAWMAAAARSRARDFAPERFRERVRALVASLPG